MAKSKPQKLKIAKRAKGSIGERVYYQAPGGRMMKGRIKDKNISGQPKVLIGKRKYVFADRETLLARSKPEKKVRGK